jgi:uncharacterized protein YcaQ
MPTTRPDSLTLAQSRRIAVAAQGLAGARPAGRIDRRHGRRVLDRTGLVQIDSVNVVARSQHLHLFARLGDHPERLLPDMTAAGDIFEYWAHEASHVPTALHPLLRWRMADARDGIGTWGRIAQAAKDEAGLVAGVLAQVRDRGPLTIGMLEGGGERVAGMWGWSPGKVALEYLFWSGQITARRGRNFERWYDLPERMLPPEVLAAPTPPPREAKKELLLIGARSHGVGTATDLADYFRLNRPEARPLLAELVDEGRLEAVRVDGWKDPAYLHPEARLPRRIRARALLSPFDPLVWERSRTERLFGFRYRIEIYVPAPQRVHGYYVLPFLLDDALVARVDLKADRAASALLVRAAFVEDGRDVERVATELAAELGELARYLGLDEGVRVEPRGDLAAALAAAVARS